MAFRHYSFLWRFLSITTLLLMVFWVRLLCWCALTTSHFLFLQTCSHDLLLQQHLGSWKLSTCSVWICDSVRLTVTFFDYVFFKPSSFTRFFQQSSGWFLYQSTLNSAFHATTSQSWCFQKTHRQLLWWWWWFCVCHSSGVGGCVEQHP